MNKPAVIGISAAALAFAGVSGAVLTHAVGDADDGYATVVSSAPIYAKSTVRDPQRVCSNERVVTRERWGTSGIIGTAIGGAAGGLLGHQIGGGSGKTVATVIGAAGGAALGNEVAYREFPDERVGYQQRCRTVSNARSVDTLKGYAVTYTYQGRTYTTNMDHDPGSRFPVQQKIVPAG